MLSVRNQVFKRLDEVQLEYLDIKEKNIQILKLLDQALDRPEQIQKEIDKMKTDTRNDIIIVNNRIDVLSSSL